jgi:hypothetical protein CRE_18438|nr:MAG TPA: hypothetical protein [Caudoviricetes sp.]
MEVKIIIEIEEGSKPIIENLSKALMVLGNTAVLSSPAGNIIGKVEKFMQPIPAEEEYAKQEMKDWQTNDVKVEPEKKEEETSKEEMPDSEKEQEEPKKKKTKSEAKKTDPVPTVKAEYTRGDLARVGRELANQGKRDEVLKAFTKFHAVSLADIQPEDFNALAQIYIDLGGKF